MTNSNWKPVPHHPLCNALGFNDKAEQVFQPKRICTCKEGTRWHGYGERVGDFAGVWAPTGWLAAGLRQDADGCVECYDCGGEGQYWLGETDSPQAVQCERCLGTGRIRIAAPVQPAAAHSDVLKQATEYAHDIVMWLHRDHYSDNTTFEPFDDLLGLLTQIDNMICGWKDHSAQPVADDVVRDAERFRWLNDHSDATWEHNYYARNGFKFVVNVPFELDDYSKPPVDFRRAIDAAMRAAQQQKVKP